MESAPHAAHPFAECDLLDARGLMLRCRAFNMIDWSRRTTTLRHFSSFPTPVTGRCHGALHRRNWDDSFLFLNPEAEQSPSPGGTGPPFTSTIRRRRSARPLVAAAAMWDVVDMSTYGRRPCVDLCEYGIEGSGGRSGLSV